MTDAAPADPIAHFSTLYQKAATTLAEPDAMVLSTVDPDGRPSGRYVLLKKVDASSKFNRAMRIPSQGLWKRQAPDAAGA